MESEENNINSITVYKDKQSIVNLKQTSKKKILFQKVLFTSILIIILICVLLILFKKKKNRKFTQKGKTQIQSQLILLKKKIIR